MTSIRLFLTLTIIAIITLVNFVSSLRGYQESMAEAETLFNQQLLENAILLSNILPENDASIMTDRLMSERTTSEDNAPGFLATVVFQVFDRDGNLMLNFNTDAKTPVRQLTEGYSDVNFDGYRWQTLGYYDYATQRWILTAQRDDIRFALAEQVILESVLPIVIGIPIAGILAWILIGAGLRPIARLAGELEGKEIADLSPVAIHGLPRELEPLQQSTNKLLHRLQASFEREKRFAADAAHELRTPISVLKVQMHNLLAELDSPMKSAEQLKTGIDRMGHLVEQILDLNRTAPDIYMANFETLDLYGLCQNTIRENYETFVAKGQEIELQGENVFIEGDRFALQTLLKNLLDNASKYTQAGGKITLSTTTESESVKLQITDNGPGIPLPERNRAFERFYRVGGDRHSTTQPGCGLGLAIVKHIVDLHKASIALGSGIGGEGLTVTIRFNKSKFGNSNV
ncbi:MAG: ATP-binding protein [Pseudohongiellaceae bacterium]